MDKRAFFEFYLSLLRVNHLLVYTFYTTNDYNIKLTKLCLFIITFVLLYVVNALFYNDATMHKIYEDKGKYDFIYQIPQMIYSTAISSIIKIILSKLTSTEKKICEIKNIKNKEASIKEGKKFLKSLKIKLIIFFILDIILLLIFWYYLGCFGAVYKNTQWILFKDVIISFCTSFIYPFGLELIPCTLRILVLRAKKKNKNCLYKISVFAQVI